MQKKKGAQVEIYKLITIRVLQEFVYLLYRGCGSGLMQVQAVKVAVRRSSSETRASSKGHTNPRFKERGRYCRLHEEKKNRQRPGMSSKCDCQNIYWIKFGLCRPYILVRLDKKKDYLKKGDWKGPPLTCVTTSSNLFSSNSSNARPKKENNTLYTSRCTYPRLKSDEGNKDHSCSNTTRHTEGLRHLAQESPAHHPKPPASLPQPA